ncbi:MAG: hypothetical protein IPP43_00240 [Chitinophagaceae bacterium]|nr:hypothetical protein [Chitinophagaceae bacterium]MBK9570175.1 hypothetical protein [Chitinophagaceae bacterium]MBL0129732.1 hypothetical protein [Chitinophagaceae bacterium]
MKKLLLIVLTLSLLSACGKSKSGKDIAAEICDCSKKANAMDAADPKRTEAQSECQRKQIEAWDKVKDDEKKATEFNKVLGECATEQIKKSFDK